MTIRRRWWEAFLTLLALQAAVGHVPFQSWSLFIALLLVTAIGIADDAHELSHRAKFVAQAMGAAVIVSGTLVWVTHMGNLAGLGAMELGMLLAWYSIKLAGSPGSAIQPITAV